MPVYQLELYQFEVCKDLIQSIAPGYSATGAMVQYLDNGRIDIAVRLQHHKTLDCGLIAATSSDSAATWDKIILRDEKGGPAHLICYADGNNSPALDAGPSFTSQPQKEDLGLAEDPFSSNEGPMIVDAVRANVNAFPAQAPPVATYHGDSANLADAAPKATQAFEAGGSRGSGDFSQDTPVDVRAEIRDPARYESDKDLANEGSVSETPTSNEQEQMQHDGGPRGENEDNGRSPTPPSSGGQRNTMGEYEDHGSPDAALDNDSSDDNSDDGSGNGGRPGVPASRPHDNSHGNLHDINQMQTNRTELPFRFNNTSDGLAPFDGLAALMENSWHANTLPSAPHAPLNPQPTSSVPQSTPPMTDNGRQHENSKHGGEGKRPGYARQLIEDYDSSEDGGEDYESQDDENQDSQSGPPTGSHEADDSKSRPEAAHSSDSEDDDSDFASEDSRYDASQSGSESAYEESDFRLSDTEVQDIQSPSDDNEDDESGSESESAPEYSGTDEGAFGSEDRAGSTNHEADESVHESESAHERSETNEGEPGSEDHADFSNDEDDEIEDESESALEHSETDEGDFGTKDRTDSDSSEGESESVPEYSGTDESAFGSKGRADSDSCANDEMESDSEGASASENDCPSRSNSAVDSGDESTSDDDSEFVLNFSDSEANSADSGSDSAADDGVADGVKDEAGAGSDDELADLAMSNLKV